MFCCIPFSLSGLLTADAFLPTLKIIFCGFTTGNWISSYSLMTQPSVRISIGICSPSALSQSVWRRRRLRLCLVPIHEIWRYEISHCDLTVVDLSTCVFLSTSRDHPIHLWDAYSGKVKKMNMNFLTPSHVHLTWPMMMQTSPLPPFLCALILPATSILGPMFWLNLQNFCRI